MLCMFCGILLLAGCSSKKYEAKTEIEQSGNTFVIGDLSLEVKSKDIREEVKPRKPQGYYNHYKKKKGYHYHLLYGTLKNMGTEKVDVNQIIVEGVNGDERYQGKLVLINEIESYFWNEIQPGGELDFYIFSVLNDKHDNPKEYHFYYDEDGRTEEQTCFDFGVRYYVPSDLEIDKEH